MATSEMNFENDTRNFLHYSNDSKSIVEKVYQTCKQEKDQGSLMVPLSAPLRRTATMTGVSEMTVSRISCKLDSEKRKTRSDKFLMDEFDQCVLRRTINDMITRIKVLPTVPALHQILREKIDYKGGQEHLRQELHRLGFTWKRVASNRKLLIERSDIVTLRAQFLRKIKQLRATGRPIVYMDETYIQAGHSPNKCWQSAEIQHHVPFSKGERIIIVHAGSADGFVKGADLIFKSKSKSGDYHDDMNFENFKRWLENKLIPNLPANSILVIDNAPYHNKQDDRCPTQATRKAEIQAWLRRKGVEYTDIMLKAELLQLCKKNKPQPAFTINGILQQHGHDCIRLPPYHADLNAIELVWAKLKREVAEKNFSFKIADVMNHAEEALKNVSADFWKSCCKHVEDAERSYWESDIAVEKEVEKVEFFVSSGDEATDTASEGENSETDTAENSETDTADEY